MKKEPQIGIRVGVPAFFALELENVYRHSEGAHRALAFPDFVGLLVGMGLDQYRKGKALPEAAQEEAPDSEGRENRHADPLHFFREFDDTIEQTDPPEHGQRIRFVHKGEPA